MKGFDIQKGFLVSDESKNVSISISNGSDIAFKYMTIEVESIGLAGEQVNISAQSENGETFDGTIKLNQGSNIINFGKKDNWQNIRLNFNIGKNSILIFNIESITFSEHRAVFNDSLFLFLFLFVIFGILSFLFVYRSFAQWLKIHPAFILAVILLLQVSQIIFYMDKRKDLHVDEVRSIYNLSGGMKESKNPNILSPHSSWKFNYVFVSPDSELNPRFFNSQLYTVASLFPNIHNTANTSKWFALINLFWFILTGIVLYFLSKLILKNDLTALFPTLLWGFSGGTVSMTYFIRAYATACFFAVLFLYLSCLLIDKDRSNIKLYIFLAVTMFFGFFSHYYFLIWAFFVCVFAGIYLLFVKRYKDIFRYAGAVVLGICLNFLLFYNLLIDHFFRPNIHTTTTLKALSGKGISFVESISQCFRQINLYVFDNSLGIIFIVLGLILISFVAVIIKRNLRAIDGEGQISLSVRLNKIIVLDYKIILIFFVSFFYFSVIAYISTFKTLRYFYLFTPSLVLLLIIIFDSSLSFIIQIKQITKRLKFDEKKIKNVLLSVIVLLLVLSGFHTGNKRTRPLHYFYYRDSKFTTVFSELNVIFVTNTKVMYQDPELLPYIAKNINARRISLFNKSKKWQGEFLEYTHSIDNFLFVPTNEFIDKNGSLNKDILVFLHKNGFQEKLLAVGLTNYKRSIYKISRTKQKGQQ
jgi:hypothetical protein